MLVCCTNSSPLLPKPCLTLCLFQCDTRKVKLEEANRSSVISTTSSEVEDSVQLNSSQNIKKETRAPHVPVVRKPAPASTKPAKPTKTDIGSNDIPEKSLSRGIVFVQRLQLECLKKFLESAEDDYKALARAKPDATYQFVNNVLFGSIAQLALLAEQRRRVEKRIDTWTFFLMFVIFLDFRHCD